MDKRTLLAIILTVLVITVSMVIQTTFFSPTATASSESSTASSLSNDAGSRTSAEQTTATVSSSDKTTDNAIAEKFTYETDLYQIEFDSAGASISAMKLKQHKDTEGNFVDMLFRGDGDHNAFLMYWGSNTTNPIEDVYSYKIEGKKVVFSHDYVDSNGNDFTVIKTFEFKDGEYLFAVSVDIVGSKDFGGLNMEGYAYTLAYEPQVGPSFTQMKNNNYDYRRVYVDYYKSNGKLSKTMAKFSNGEYTISSPVKWMQVTSKYFTVVALPEDSNIGYKFMARQSTGGGIAQSDSLYISRPDTDSGTSDTIYFYAGPQLKKYLGSYYSGMDNNWGIRNSNLDHAAESGSMFGWLETILMWMLAVLYKIVPNYGVGIILLTILIKILLWPLSRKSLSSTAKMTALQPKQQEIQAKYKDNPQKMNQEMAALYKEAGASPLGGCLPMLLQFPVIIAMYGLLNKHFELRSAMFIPGWIPDLSVPETVYTLPFNIPLLGNEIHLLPILYTVSMIFSMRMSGSQNTGGSQGQGMMKMMTYGMPIMFFFVLYSAPSGLLLYWSVQNALSMIQQVYTNNKLKRNPDAFASKKNGKAEEKVPEAVRKYQEKLKRLEEEKARQAKNNKKR